jgi:predicted nuclease of predicted toxin-antitoxin system
VARFFVDECVAVEIVEALRAAGLDVAYAKEVCPGRPDPEVLELAADDGRVLVTHDLGFGELAVRFGQPAAGVVVLSLYTLPRRWTRKIRRRETARVGRRRSRPSRGWSSRVASERALCLRASKQ